MGHGSGRHGTMPMLFTRRNSNHVTGTNHNTSSTADYSGQYYSTDSYGQQQQHPSQDYIDMLIEEAEKLYNKLTKEWVDQIIMDYASNISFSLPLLSQSDEEQRSVTSH